VPGEDPYLTGEYGTFIVKGTQEGIDPRYMQAAATMKHFQIYDYEGYQPNHGSANLPSDATCDNTSPAPHCGRGTFDASPPARDFTSYYMGAFKTVAQRASPAAIMCAYNAIYGVPACASNLTNLLARGEWGWEGMVTSDCGAVDGISGSHNYTHDPNTTIAAALNHGGVDVNCGSSSPPFYTRHLCSALANGTVSLQDIDRAARRYWKTMMKLGMFDDMESQPMVTEIGPALVDSADGRKLAQRAATESLVLLKNLNGFLPLDGNHGRLAAREVKFAFIGPHANSTQDLLSAPQYHGSNTLVQSHSPLSVARRRGWNVSHAKGVNICDWIPPGYPNMPCTVGKDGKGGPMPPPDTSGIPAAVRAAKAADVAILFLGSDQTTEAENFDREGLKLVGAQEELLKEVTTVQENVIVVLIHGGPIDVSSANASPSVRAILDAFQPGELGGDAIMDMLEGKTAPSGLLPYTVYRANYTTRDIREVDLKAGRGTTYWWHTDPPLYSFGYGLSYSSFEFKWSDGIASHPHAPSRPQASRESLVSLSQPTRMQHVGLKTSTFAINNVSADGVSAVAMNHSVTVTNCGETTSDIVALAFIVATAGSPSEMPLKKLFGFQRFVAMAPGEAREATFTSTADSLGVVGFDGTRRLHPGTYRIECGSLAYGMVAEELKLLGQNAIVL